MTGYGIIELGGTKTIVAVGHQDGSIEDLKRFETDHPDETLERATDHLRNASIVSVGIASFGPLELRRDHANYGRIVDTPKAGWTGTNLIGRFSGAFGVPVGLDTDVNAAALAEGRWGAAAGADHHVYVTVGTGIGFGVVAGGMVLNGLSHPELGHLHVVRHRGDDHPGSCPFHGDCLEGMASGPAIADRFGSEAKDLDTEARDKAVELVGFYLAQAVRALVYSVSPRRVVIGGGVSKLPGFHDSVARHLVTSMAGYRRLVEHDSPGFIVAPQLTDSGLAGAILLALEAVD